MAKIKLPFGLERNGTEPVVETTEIDHNGQPLDEVLEGVGGTTIIEVSNLRDVSETTDVVLSGTLPKTAGEIKALVDEGKRVVIKAAFNGDGVGTLYGEVKGSDEDDRLLVNFFTGTMYYSPVILGSGLIAGNNITIFFVHGATTEKVEQLESELGEFSRVVYLEEHLNGQPIEYAYESDTSIKTKPFTLVFGGLTSNYFRMDYTYRFDCWSLFSDKTYAYTDQWSILKMNEEGSMTLIGFLLRDKENAVTLVNARMSPVASIDGKTKQEWIDCILPLFNEDTRYSVKVVNFAELPEDYTFICEGAFLSKLVHDGLCLNANHYRYQPVIDSDGESDSPVSIGFRFDCFLHLQDYMWGASQYMYTICTYSGSTYELLGAFMFSQYAGIDGGQLIAADLETAVDEIAGKTANEWAEIIPKVFNDGTEYVKTININQYWDEGFTEYHPFRVTSNNYESRVDAMHFRLGGGYRVDCFGHVNGVGLTYSILKVNGNHYQPIGSMATLGNGYHLYDKEGQVEALDEHDVEWWKNFILPLFGEDLPEKVSKRVRIIDIEDIPEDGIFTCDAAFVYQITTYFGGGSSQRPFKKQALEVREGIQYRVDHINTSSDDYYYITKVPSSTTPFTYHILGILLYVGGEYSLLDLKFNQVESIDDKTVEEWTAIITPLFSTDVRGRLLDVETKLNSLNKEVVRVIDVSPYLSTGNFHVDSDYLLTAPHFHNEGHAYDVDGWRIDKMVHHGMNSITEVYMINLATTNPAGTVYLHGALRRVDDNVYLSDLEGNKVDSILGYTLPQWQSRIKKAFAQGLTPEQEAEIAKIPQIESELGELKEDVEVLDERVEELKDKSADAQDVVDLEEKVNAVARGDFGTPDYGTSMPLMCGQPMVLFGAGTPQEAIVPDNWKQYDADTDEGYNWNGLPSALGQRYINVSATSRAEYIAVRTSYDKNNANYDVLKWLNL